MVGDTVIDLFQKEFVYSVGIYSGNKIVCVEDTVSSISWGGSRNTAARHLNITCKNYESKNDFPPGRLCVLHSLVDEEKELFRGFVVGRGKKSSDHSINYTAYDCRWYLIKNKHDNIYRNMTATEIVIDICKTFGIPYDESNFVDTGIRLSSIHIINKTLWDTVLMVLTETTKQSGIKYTTKVKNGKMILVEKKTQIKKIVIEQGVNLIESTFEDSIENTYTQVYVKGKDKNGKEISAVAVDEEAQSQYGIMQEYISQSEESTTSELNTIAAQKLKELSTLQQSGKITAIGLDDIEEGDAIYVVDEETGLVGGFYVESDEHKVEGGNHVVSLDLAWTDDVASLEYEPPKEEGK